MLQLSMAMQAMIMSQIVVVDCMIFYIKILKVALEVDNVLAGRSPAGDIPSVSDICAEIFENKYQHRENKK